MTLAGDEFLAVDWGSSQRRVHRIGDNGRHRLLESDGRGVRSVAAGAFDLEVAALRTRHPGLPMLMAGMVGSNRGWRETPYVRTPVDLAILADNILWIEPRLLGIVPGVCQRLPDSPDVMRGEEVQVLGAVEAGLVPADGLVCQPGTHCKWVQLQDRRISRFTTALTGEVFALLREHSLLAGQMVGEPVIGPSFRKGLANAADTDLLTGLFRIRAATLLGYLPAEQGVSYLSGLLIGHDVRSRVASGDTIWLVAEPPLAALYAEAIRHRGGRAITVDSQTAFRHGMAAIRRMAR